MGLLVLLVTAPACRPTLEHDRFTSLYATWRFRPGDDLRWAEPAFDDRGWADLQVPKSWGRHGFDHVFGMAWYRARVAVHVPACEPVGLALGKIDAPTRSTSAAGAWAASASCPPRR